MKKNAPFTVIYEDDLLIAVNKASGLAVGGDRWDEVKERLDRLLEAFLTERTGRRGSRIFTVHRIDRDTSGLVVFAKDPETHKSLSAAFESRRVTKQYIAVVHGFVSWAETICDLPLIPNGDKQHRTIIDKYRGKTSLTRFRRLGGAGNYSVVEALPETGRTHQIRVHLASLGHPIVCDPLYGGSAGRGIEKGVLLSSFKKGWRGDPLAERPLIVRLGLHAAGLTLPGYDGKMKKAPHAPAPGRIGDAGTGEAAAGIGGELRLRAPLPRDMAALIKQMEKCASGAGLPE